MVVSDLLAAITWNVDPELVSIGPLTIRWYGLLFALGFILGYEVAKKMFQRDNIPLEWLDKAMVYVFIGTLLGARLGHVFFYDWAYYSQHLDEIIMIWKGGLASHGAAIGIIISLYVFSRKVSKKSVLWILDRTVVPVALAGAFIRTGNLMNSEIYGRPTDVAWAFDFVRIPDIAGTPVHPTQIYEALAYLAIFFVLHRLFYKTDAGKKQGFLLGMFFILVFGFRFLVEFVKADQVAFEANIPLNMGQWLSIPLVAVGVFLVIRANQIGPKEEPMPKAKPKAKKR